MGMDTPWRASEEGELESHHPEDPQVGDTATDNAGCLGVHGTEYKLACKLTIGAMPE